MQHTVMKARRECLLTTEKLPSCALTIAGSDSCGGAGIQADLKTFAAFGVYGASVLTSVTAQNTLGVFAAESVKGEIVAAQLDAVLDDLPICAAKTGMLPNAAGIQRIAGRLALIAPRIPLVVDPVMVATSGAALADEPAMEALKEHLFPLAVLVTPNLQEAAILTGRQISNPREMEAAGREILKNGCSAVLMKGGHLSSTEMTDLLITADGVKSFSHRARPGSYHGTGCTLSAAITAGLARGQTLEEAVPCAIDFVQDCIRLSRQPLKGQIRLLVCPGPDAR